MYQMLQLLAAQERLLLQDRVSQHVEGGLHLGQGLVQWPRVTIGCSCQAGLNLEQRQQSVTKSAVFYLLHPKERNK